MRNIVYALSCMLFLCISIGMDAQPTFFKVRVENVGKAFPFAQSGVFNTPVDSANPGPLFPGAAYEFSFDAAPGHYLSFATMFVQSNDLFYAPGEMGIALYDSMGNPISGDLTDQLDLWDSGTELNEAPGEGANQAPRQAGPNTGDSDTDNTVRLVDDGFSYPEDSAVIRFTLTHNGGTSFSGRIENVSSMTTLEISGGMTVPVPLAPGTFVIHTDPAPLFTVGEVDRGEGLEGIAEDGDPSLSAMTLGDQTGITSILAPGVYALHGADDPLFSVGMPDRGEGLEAIAEDGMPGMLAEALRDNPTLTAGAFAVPVGGEVPGPLLPGGAYEFIVASGPTGKLSFATMFVQSNDLFYAPDGMGIALFDESGMPISGNVTDQIDLWDAGTELNEVPGIGLNQAPRQSGADTGDTDTDNTVRLVNDAFTYPEDDSVIRVTLTPLESENFTVRIENVSTSETLVIDGNSTAPVPLAPGSWVIHSEPNPLFSVGEPDRGLGLEGIAEDGDVSAFEEAFSMKMGTPRGIFTTPVDSAGPGPLFPGASYEFSFTAAEGMYLSLATMFVQSNDLFYAPDGNGVVLFDESGNSISGDVTDQFQLWDAGTEENEQPGVGENQAPRQSGPNTGPIDSDNTVRLVSDAFTYPDISSVVRITINEEDMTPPDTVDQPAGPAFFNVRIENVGGAFDFAQSGVFNTPVGENEPGPLMPGNAYEFDFDAAPGQKLSFATMFVQSNDLFYAPGEMGIALYDSMGNPISGDLTDQLDLWDAGTELNEAPAEGPNQAPRQSGPNTGEADTDSTVRLVTDDFTYPDDTSVIKFILTHNGGTSFTGRIENVCRFRTIQLSNGERTFTPLAPGIFIVHSGNAPLFTVGEPDRGEGLEGIAEDGDPSQAAATAMERTGVTTILAPGIYAVHGADDPLFTVGMPDRGEGLEAIAEDGDPAMLADALRDNTMLTAGAFAIPAGAEEPGPILPGGAYEFMVAAGPSGKLSFATMFVQSNDLFFAPDGMGIDLFDQDSIPISGDVTDQIDLWDAGTEENEVPGIGPNQAPRQSGPNTGATDSDNTVRLVDDGFIYPMVNQSIRVTITPIESQEFTLRIQNVSTSETLEIDEENSVPIPLAPGPWVLHTTSDPLFTDGEPVRGLGLEEIAEDGDPSMFAAAFSMKMGTPNGVFTTPVDSTGPGPLFPGAIYEFTFRAAPGSRLSLATMFVQSNDLFYAPDGSGIALFNESGEALSGDVTEEFLLWDAGTEENEQPGVGENQAPRQSGANVGPVDPDNTVRLVSDPFTYPQVSEVIKVTLNMEISTPVAELLDAEDSFVSGFTNFPNPLKERTGFDLQLTESGPLNLSIFNLQGMKVAEVLPTTLLSAGSYQFTWDGKDAKGNKLGTGLYFARLNGFEKGVSTLRILVQE